GRFPVERAEVVGRVDAACELLEGLPAIGHEQPIVFPLDVDDFEVPAGAPNRDIGAADEGREFAKQIIKVESHTKIEPATFVRPAALPGPAPSACLASSTCNSRARDVATAY